MFLYIRNAGPQSRRYGPIPVPHEGIGLRSRDSRRGPLVPGDIRRKRSSVFTRLRRVLAAYNADP